MRITDHTPSMDGYRMPGEFEPHRGCIMIWPDRPGSWPFGAKAAKQAFAKVAAEIAKSEALYMLAEERLCAEAAEYLSRFVPTVKLAAGIKEYGAAAAGGPAEPQGAAVEIVPIPTDDAWARDVCPTFVVNRAGALRGVSWRFNAWGGDYDGLYAHWEQDDACAGRVCEHLGVPYYDAGGFVLEGGSIHSDGEGTILTTEACLLSPGRNPELTKEEIEQNLKNYLGAKKVIWLPHGISGDETNEHVDNMCAFVRPGEVVLAWPDHPDRPDRPDCLDRPDCPDCPGRPDCLDRPDHPDCPDRTGEAAGTGRNATAKYSGGAADMQLKYSEACLRVLEEERDAMGRKIRVHKLSLPKRPVCIQKEDLPGFRCEEGEAERFEGEQLAASYVNFYISNRSVLVPQFRDENDAAAVKTLSALFPEREIVPVYARDILMGGGNIHCITQQIP